MPPTFDLKQCMLDPVGYFEQFLLPVSNDDLTATIVELVVQLERTHDESVASELEMAKGLVERELENRNTICVAGENWEQSMVGMELQEVVKNLHGFQENARRLRSEQGFSDWLDISARIADVCAELCQIKITKLGRAVGEGNSSELPS